jgi:hypothetical protein
MPTDAVAAFLAQLRKTQILEEPQLAEADRLGATAARPGEVAAELIKRGWLTPYQANQVARGRGEELVLGAYVILEPLGRSVIEPFTVAVHDVAVLELRVYTEHNGANSSRAVWLDPYVVVGEDH